MDNHNVITPTSNLDDLQNDMVKWAELPYKIRKRSIDDCMRMYGMTVIDLYNANKEAILRNEDKKEIDPSNLVRESMNMEKDYYKYDQLLAASKLLQQSPYIIILDPDIKTIEELNDKYNRYYLLNYTNKMMCNNYSLKLWGRNIYSMYLKLTAQINAASSEDEIKDDSNLVVGENTLAESAILPVIDLYLEALMDNDIIFACELKKNMTSGSILESVIVDKHLVEETGFDKTILPKVVPWFTMNESAHIAQDIDVDRFYTILKQKLNIKDDVEKEKEVLDTGWNPSVDLTDKAMDHARDRQAEFFNKVDIINIKNIRTDTVEQPVTNNSDLVPVFFVLGYDKILNEFDITKDYKKAGIILRKDMSKVYTFNGVDNTFKGFKSESIYDYKYIDVVVMFVDKATYMTISKSIDKVGVEEYSKYNFNSIFSVLSRTSNIYSPDNMKIIYTRYINMLLRLANIYVSDNSSLVKTDFATGNTFNIFKVFSGSSNDYTREVVVDIIKKLNLISDNESLNSLIEKRLGETNKELLERMTPINCIYKKE